MMRSAAFVVSVLLCAAPLAADQCICPAWPSWRFLDEAAAVFRATAVSVDYLEEDAPSKEPAVLVTFELHEVWKGPSAPRVLLRTTHNKWTCEGYNFQGGQQYLVMAAKVDGEGSAGHPPELRGVSRCGTRAVEGAADVPADLGRGRRVTRK